MMDQDFLERSLVNHEFAQWICFGLHNPLFHEHKGSYIASCAGNKVTGCALGAALVGKIGDAHEALALFMQMRNQRGSAILFFAHHLGLPVAMVKDIDKRHSNGECAEDIARSFQVHKLPW